MTKFIQQRPQARALSKRVRGRHVTEAAAPARPSVEQRESKEPEQGGQTAQRQGGARTPPPVEPEIYRPKRASGAYSLTGERRAPEPAPRVPTYTPLRASDLLPPPPDDLLAYLRFHLDAGETRYAPRQGLLELRARLAQELSAMGIVEVDAHGIVITAGEGEALFLTLMSCGIGAGDHVRLSGAWQAHEELLDILGVTPPETAGNGTQDTDTETSGAVHIVLLGRAVGLAGGSAAPSRPSQPGEAVYIGSLDGLPHLPSFRLGFVAGPLDRIERIGVWKGAFSLATAAPSQRAAIFAFERSQDDGARQGMGP